MTRKPKTPATSRPKTAATANPSSTGSAPARGTRPAADLAPIATACGFGAFDAHNLPGACWRPYSDASPFNKPLPASPRLSPNSDAVVATLTGWGPPASPIVGNADTPGDYYHPYYFSGPSDPVFTVHCTEAWGTCAVEGLQIRIPDAARAAGGDDAHLAVVDQQAGWEYDFWGVQSKPHGGGTLVVSWGGRTRIGTDDADGLGSDATAAHFGLLAGIVRYPELAAGHIDHALFMTAKCSNGHLVFPAAGTGAGCGGPNAPAMGVRFFLDMSDAEIDALDVPAWRKTILRAMAQYGMFFGDTGGSSWSVAMESGSTYTSFGMQDPWTDFGSQPGVQEWNGTYLLPIAGGVDWASRLRVADPCVTQGTC